MRRIRPIAITLALNRSGIDFGQTRSRWRVALEAEHELMDDLFRCACQRLHHVSGIVACARVEIFIFEITPNKLTKLRPGLRLLSRAIPNDRFLQHLLSAGIGSKHDRNSA